MKPRPERLDIATYPYRTKIEPRFGDMDVQRHLNNVALAGIYEEGRVRFSAGLKRPTADDGLGQPMLAQATIRYLAEGLYPDAIVVGVGTLRVGRTSYVMGEALFQNDRCIGLADIVVVWTLDGRPTPIPDAFRAALSTTLLASPVDADA